MPYLTWAASVAPPSTRAFDRYVARSESFDGARFSRSELPRLACLVRVLRAFLAGIGDWCFLG